MSDAPAAIETFDVIVIGGGPAGETAAGRCADRGFSVALVERELVGGECSYWGCIPSKTLIRPGDVVAAARRVPGAAEAVTGSIDVEAAFAQRDYMTSGWNDAGQVPWLDEQGHRARARRRPAGRREGGRGRCDRRWHPPARRDHRGGAGHRHHRGDPTGPRAAGDRAVGQPVDHVGQGATPPPAGAGRRRHRRRDGSGVPPARLRGGHGGRSRRAAPRPGGALRR